MTTFVGIGVIGLLVACMTAWISLAIYYSGPPGDYLRAGLAGLFPLATLAAFFALPRRDRTLCWFFVVFALILVWWTTITPSNTRNWQADVAVLPYATIAGNFVTIHNIRNFTYRTETDFDVHYYDKTFDLDKLDSVDLNRLLDGRCHRSRYAQFRVRRSRLCGVFHRSTEGKR